MDILFHSPAILNRIYSNNTANFTMSMSTRHDITVFILLMVEDFVNSFLFLDIPVWMYFFILLPSLIEFAVVILPTFTHGYVV